MRLVIALSLLLSPAVAEAGQRATYTDSSKQKLVIEVGANGHARISGPDPAQYGILRDGRFYLVAQNEGKLSVARMEDVAEALSRAMPSVFKDLFGAAAASAKPENMRIEAKGKRSYGGYEGDYYHVFFAGAEKPDDPIEYLVSKEASLKPVGAALEQFSLALTMLMGAFMGPAVKEDMAQTRAVFALGTPLDIEGGYKLVSLEEAEIAHERLELPAKPKTLEEVIAETVVNPLPAEEGQPDPRR